MSPRKRSSSRSVRKSKSARGSKSSAGEVSEVSEVSESESSKPEQKASPPKKRAVCKKGRPLSSSANEGAGASDLAHSTAPPSSGGTSQDPIAVTSGDAAALLPAVTSENPLATIARFHTPEGIGKAIQLSGLSADRLLEIVESIATGSKNDTARLAAVKWIDDKTRDVLRTANVLRVTKNREVLVLPEQTITDEDGNVRTVSGHRESCSEEQALVMDSVSRTEEKLKRITAGATVADGEHEYEDEEEDL